MLHSGPIGVDVITRIWLLNSIHINIQAEITTDFSESSNISDLELQSMVVPGNQTNVDASQQPKSIIQGD